MSAEEALAPLEDAGSAAESSGLLTPAEQSTEVEERGPEDGEGGEKEKETKKEKEGEAAKKSKNLGPRSKKVRRRKAGNQAETSEEK
jgi:hypothetical protein